MAKTAMQKVYDPKEDQTHVVSSPLADGVTLCGQTDFLGQEPGDYDTSNPVDCSLCLNIFKYCNSHSWPK